MLHLTIVAVGKIKEDYLRQGIAEYQKRLTAYTKLKIVEVPDSPLGRAPGEAQKEEGKRIQAVLKPRSFVAVCDPRGRKLTSEGFARWLAARESGGQEVYLVIGGASGLAPEVTALADDRLSFSDLTFPHQLFRLVLLEQIYRGFKILRGEPYHL
ncbi:MAG TPA: 23S rRNA (pseudouridine(1915)-N(3))-methyltransferase RlmH [Firmicutes bacterium]|uniref:Ribosomal RNA large subunit methyltransferase H n=1 Tax=Capillibacterium thermochitinicola TaxID=2699427 RepID=A0A8J6HSA0_9FIRM|nr:23S rRNA (pseudouridine(1915)-N(3))-methyltransferase RlmH [Capillibacterium thermochitinicola]MBA2133206.1 23S rRNA (pseudouridine(1915)-N(3))-methyltransferase RlmH [Capillibacterium thermochitinicola]HHW12218.1 23S rRNA (pseudouridine(1915)-N(3))-methyltransferase RlmH [Bacillota bacterium]